MIYYCDTEFTKFQGELLSIALVPQDASLPHYYAEVKHTGEVDPWVVENVMKHMSPEKDRISHEELAAGLHAYLHGDNEVVVIADWPEDLAFFMRALIRGPGYMINIDNVTTTLKRTRNWNSADHSAIPHHALQDAIAIRNFWNPQHTPHSHGAHGKLGGSGDDR